VKVLHQNQLFLKLKHCGLYECLKERQLLKQDVEDGLGGQRLLQQGGMGTPSLLHLYKELVEL
jgi:hypothetical protein